MREPINGGREDRYKLVELRGREVTDVHVICTRQGPERGIAKRKWSFEVQYPRRAVSFLRLCDHPQEDGETRRDEKT
jgi:hypothetical protein